MKTINFNEIKFQSFDGTLKQFPDLEKELAQAIYNLSQERHLPLTMLAMDMYKGNGKQGDEWESKGDHEIDDLTLQKLADFVAKLGYPDSVYFPLVEYLNKVKNANN